MLKASSCHSCIWMSASPPSLTYVVAACIEEQALSLSRVLHTPHIYLYQCHIFGGRGRIQHVPPPPPCPHSTKLSQFHAVF